MRLPHPLCNVSWSAFAVRRLGLRPWLLACLVLLVLAAPARAWQFAVVADSQITENSASLALLREIAQALTQQDIDLVIFPGDVVMAGNYATTLSRYRLWQRTLVDPLRQAGIEVFPVRGNHDALPDAWREAFSGDYALPDDGPPGEVGQTYSFVHENALFLALDEVVSDKRKYTVNQRWVDAKLKANTQPHVFAFGHMPAFAMYKFESMAVRPLSRDLFWQSLGRAHGAYFCGHDHFFDHAKACDWFGRWVPHVVTGTNMIPLHNWNGPFLNPRVKRCEHIEQNGYIIVSVEGNNKSITFMQHTGENTFEPVYTDSLLPR